MKQLSSSALRWCRQSAKELRFYLSKITLSANTIQRTVLIVCLSALMTFGWSIGQCAWAASDAEVDASTPTESSVSDTTTESATDIFRRAYDSRYTWDDDFPGYQAEVSARYEGQLYHGVVRINPNLTVDVLNIGNEDVNQLVASQLQMTITHLQPVPFELRHEEHTFEFVNPTAQAGTVEIRQLGDGSNSIYKVKDQQIKQVNRTLGAIAVEVNTLGSIKTLEGYLTTRFQVTFKDAQTGDVLEEDDVRDFYEKIGKYYLLTNRDIRFGLEEGPTARPTPDINLHFNDVQPLTET